MIGLLVVETNTANQTKRAIHDIAIDDID